MCSVSLRCMGLEAGSTWAAAEAGVDGMPGGGGEGSLPDAMGVVELLFRGHSIADMAEAAGMPVIAIVRALSEHNFDHLRHLHKALVLGREFKIERLRLEAAEKLAQMASALLDDHPKGLTADQVRATDAQRRAILSIL